MALNVPPELAATNGHAPVPRRVVKIGDIKRTAVLDLDDPRFEAFGYAGVQLTLWTNPPGDVLDRTKGKPASEALAPLILDWNLAGPDGRVLPISAATLGQIPLDLLGLIDTYWGEQFGLPLQSVRNSSPSPRKDAE